MSKILVIEDEAHLAEGLRFNLEAEGHLVELAASGERGLELAPAADLIVLDVMLPGKDGFAVASELRAARRYMPILMLTARGSAEDVLRGFDAGADDYLAKPFELSILLARIGGLLRRREWHTAPPDTFDFDGRHVDFASQCLEVGDRRLALTLMETNLLRHLIQHQGQTVARKTMLAEVWGLTEDTDTRAIDNFVVRLRRYIEPDPARPRYLTTVRGVGYRFTARPS